MVDRTVSSSVRSEECRPCDGLARWVAEHLPRRVVYFAVVRAWAHATSGEHAHVAPPLTTVDEALRHWEEASGDAG